MKRLFFILIIICLFIVPAAAFASGLDVEIEGERFGYVIPAGAPVISITANGIEAGSNVYMA